MELFRRYTEGYNMLKRKDITIIFSVVLMLSSLLQAGSIYAKRTCQSKALYADDTARQIGDLITIVITEESKIGNSVERDLSNKSSRSSSFDGELNIDHILPSIPGFTMEQESARSLEGESEYTDERSFEDQITVVVEDIQPNGNLVVLGYRERNIANDKQLIQVSGLIRPSDVTFDNTIRSDQVANLKLVTINEGVSQDYNKPGWLANIFDFLWPF